MDGRLTYVDPYYVLDASPAMFADAKSAGMIRSNTATPASRGWRVYFTENPYSAVNFFRLGDDEAKRRLDKLDAAIQRSRAEDSFDDFPCPKGQEYLPFQRAGIDFALSRPHTLIGDDMGLGKTVQALGVANAMKARSLLVVCPAAVRLQWATMINRWLVSRQDGSRDRGHLHVIRKTSDGVHPDATLVVLSYEMATNAAIWPALMARKWDLAVVDEAHYLKNHDAKRTRAVLGGWDGQRPGIMDVAGRVLMLTGTPLPARPREMYTIARALCWDAIGRVTQDSFLFEYNPSATLADGTRVEETGNLLELQARLRSHFMIRRLKADVAKDMPAKSYEMVEIEPDGAIKRILQAERLLHIDPDNIRMVPFDEQGHIATLRREMGVAKAGRVVEHVEMLMDGGLDKVVVFCYHREVAAILAAELSRYGLAAVLGGTSPAARADAVSRFGSDPKVRVFLGQITAAGTGIDGLQKACSWCVFAEPSWTPGDNEQCVDRLHRTGQKLPVTAQFLVAPKSLDSVILASAIRKYRVTNVALDRQSN